MNISTTINLFFSKSVFCVFLFLIASNSLYSQIKKDSVTVIEKLNVNKDLIALETNVDFINWFTGSKQVQFNYKKEETLNTVSRKKQILSSGITPNKLLYKTFIKKVISKDLAIA